MAAAPTLVTGVALVCLICLLGEPATAFYIPGVAPQEFHTGDSVNIKAVKLTSVIHPLPYEYYFLPFCRPKKLRHRTENLGEVLRGDRITNTPYELVMNKNISCAVLCHDGDGKPGRLFGKNAITRLSGFVRKAYRAHWLLDNLPAATRVQQDGLEEPDFVQGFPIGYIDEKNQQHVFNHLLIIIKTHEATPGVFRIVGFEIKTASIAASEYAFANSDQTCSVQSIDVAPQRLRPASELTSAKTERIVWSYGVKWEPSPVAWASRWDTYLTMADPQIHWFSIINSLVTVIFLTGVCAVILVRTLSADIARYNNESEEDDIEPTGWKLVHGDVFRPPAGVGLLITFLGTGIQLFFVILITLVFACLGMLSPASRGALMTVAILLFMFMGVVAGFYAARFYRTLGGQNWRSAAVRMGLFFPGLVFGTSFFLNFLVWGEASSGAVPFGTMVVLLLLWFGLSLPLVVGGFFFGFRKQAYEFPCNVNPFERMIPPQPLHLKPYVSVPVAGILPFGAVFIELYFILTAIWENQFYYLFGFLFLVTVVIFVCCAEISLVMVYMQLCTEDYHWWWRSFFISGGSAFYVFLYSVFYYSTRLQIDSLTPTILYFAYSFLGALAFFFVTGTIGFVASFMFVRQIYGAVKID